MTAEGSEPRRWRRRVVWPLAGLGVIGAVALVGWVNRTSIATGIVDRYLRESAVPVRYRIAHIGVGTHRLTDIVVGDPARPDLTVKQAELTLGMGWSGPYVAAVRADGVRLRARWTGDRLSFGAVDRLLPASSGGPTTLPDMHLSLHDAALALTTPWGPVGVGLEGRGQLSDGYRGLAAVRAPRLALEGCAMSAVDGMVRLSTARGLPQLRGPLGAGALDCPERGVRARDLRLGVEALGQADLTQWRIASGVRGGAARAGDIALGGISGRATADIRRKGAVDARWDISGLDAQTPWLDAGRLTMTGRGARNDAGGVRADGHVILSGGRASAGLRQRLAGLSRFDDSTPVGPLARKLGRALAAAAGDVAGQGGYALDWAGAERMRVTIGEVALRATSGAQLAIAGADAVRWDRSDGLAFAGTAQIGGGGLPEGRITLRRARPDAPVSGEALMEPYAADGAVLALAPLRFTARAGGVAFATGVAVSGPLGSGAVDRLAMPLAGRIGGDGTLHLSGECRALTWHGLRAGGMTLDPASLRLCGQGGDDLLVADRRGLRGGAVFSGARLAGGSGGSPLLLTTSGGQVSLTRPGFAVSGFTLDLGRGDSVTRFAAARIDGAIGGGGLSGSLTDAEGKIGPVPFLFAQGQGRWRVDGGALLLDARLGVTDAADVDRFQPMVSEDVALRLRDGVIRVTGRLREARASFPVADLTITHDLSHGTGAAHFVVPRLAFARGGLQPVDISSLALGVIANTEGVVSGEGDVRWNEGGVTSSGSFTTSGLNFAAAFGPVEGMAGTIRFDDLIGLTTPPGQEVTLHSVNPGIEVVDGRVRYQLLPGQQVRVESGMWPFAGGKLLLQPTLLDFSADHPRRLMFDVSNVDAALFLQRYEFENISATGTFDGILPTVFDADGGRVEGGMLTSRAGGSLAYVGELGNHDLGMMGNMAFGALKALKYDSLVIRLNGRIDGDMVTDVGFSGLAQGEGVSNGLLTRWLRGLPFTFSIRINAPFRQLLTSARGLYDPSLLIEQNLPALLQAQEEDEKQQKAAHPADAPPVQPSESEDQR